MIVCAVQALAAGDRASDAVLQPLRHVIVDEYQDTNPAQEQLVQLLASRGAHVTVVGDDDQSIYQWRGATVKNILTFADRYESVKTIELPHNRRSQPSIIDVAEAFVQEKVSERLPKSMKAHREDEGGLVTCWAADTADDEAEVLATTVLRLHEQGFAWRDMAVLLRSVKTSAAPIVTALESRGVPVRSSGASGLFVEADAHLFARTYAWLADKEWNEDRWSPSFVTIDLHALLDDYAAAFQLKTTAKEQLRRRLQKWHDETQDDKVTANLVGDFYALLSLLGARQWDLGKNPDLEARFGTAARFSSLLADFEHATKRARRHHEDGQIRGGAQGGPWLYLRLYWFMQYYALTSYEGFVGEETLDYNAVEVSTIHAAKGLQWPIVFMPGLTARRFPSSRTGRAQDYLVPSELFDRPRYEGSEEDEARLCYVAMTRARDALYLSRFRKIKNRQSASPYWEFVQDRVGEFAGEQLPLPRLPQTQVDSGDELPIISFSDIAAFWRCPTGYRLRTLLGFQPLLAKELGYGKAVHHVLRRVADATKEAGAVPDRSEIVAIIDNEFFLPFADSLAYKQMRQAAETLVTAFVATHRDDFERIWRPRDRLNFTSTRLWSLGAPTLSLIARVARSAPWLSSTTRRRWTRRTSSTSGSCRSTRRLAGAKTSTCAPPISWISSEETQRTSTWMRRRLRALSPGPARRSLRWWGAPSCQSPAKTSADVATCR
jgi:DNA helicase-2/ATP-dependent DNA helicase PcrA